MKKIWKYILICLLLVLFIACIFFTPSNDNKKLLEDVNDIYENAKNESSMVKEEEQKDFTEINVSTYLEKYKESKNSVVLLRRNGCQYCQIAEPLLKKIAKKYNLEIFTLTTDTFTEEDKNIFLASDEFFNNSFGTPLLMIIGENQMKDNIDGLTDYEHYVDTLEKNNVIS